MAQIHSNARKIMVLAEKNFGELLTGVDVSYIRAVITVNTTARRFSFPLLQETWQPGDCKSYITYQDRVNDYETMMAHHFIRDVCSIEPKESKKKGFK